MAEITVEESWRQIRTLTDRAEQASADGRPDEAVERWRAVLAHPCAHHQVAAYEIFDEIHQACRQAGRYEDAIAAKREAIAAGYRSVPDPEADIAECLLAAGRIGEAAARFATLRERDPEDVWLYNAAAYSYADIDVAMSLRWALDGIEVALATGDPDQVVMQLLECAEAAWEELDEPVDQQLVDTVERFCEAWTPVPSGRGWGDLPPLEVAGQDTPLAHRVGLGASSRSTGQLWRSVLKPCCAFGAQLRLALRRPPHRHHLGATHAPPGGRVAGWTPGG